MDVHGLPSSDAMHHTAHTHLFPTAVRRGYNRNYSIGCAHEKRSLNFIIVHHSCCTSATFSVPFSRPYHLSIIIIIICNGVLRSNRFSARHCRSSEVCSESQNQQGIFLCASRNLFIHYLHWDVWRRRAPYKAFFALGYVCATSASTKMFLLLYARKCRIMLQIWYLYRCLERRKKSCFASCVLRECARFAYGVYHQQASYLG